MTRTSDQFPYQFTVPMRSKQWRADAWCTEKFGPRWSAVDNRGGTWCCFWSGRDNPGHYDWLFRNERDALLFLLRWS